MIDPRRLRVLQAVAAHGSVVGAADALRLSPPAVSQQLLALERETGASLIDRAGRQVRLTAAGRLLAAHGELIATDPLPWPNSDWAASTSCLLNTTTRADRPPSQASGCATWPSTVPCH
jgi:Bacterial regulatory helix-turn-helix protein, lysR family